VEGSRLMQAHLPSLSTPSRSPPLCLSLSLSALSLTLSLSLSLSLSLCVHMCGVCTDKV
jgi:hypothetical protein